ncbi:MAG: hypothetical protein ACRC2V_15440, partial [Xenococcaceae cyanobacterium]
TSDRVIGSYLSPIIQLLIFSTCYHRLPITQKPITHYHAFTIKSIAIFFMFFVKFSLQPMTWLE